MLNRQHLSKTFDCIVHDSLITKLEAYDFSYEVIQSYFIDRKHRHKINNSFSNFIDLFIGVPQGSILDPLLFKITSAIFFYSLKKKMLRTDDTTPYSNSGNVVTVLEDIETKEKMV